MGVSSGFLAKFWAASMQGEIHKAKEKVFAAELRT